MNLLGELKRRNVFRVAAAYLVLSWLLLQVVDVVAPLLALSDAFGRGVLLLLALGCLPVLLFSWVYELTPEGIRRESEIDAQASVAAHTGRRLDLVTIAMIVLGVVVIIADRLWLPGTTGPTVAAEVEGASIGDSPAPTAATSEVTIDDHSIAVLPFVNLSSNAENEYFADGLSEELLNRLAQLPELLVAGRTSSFSFKGRNEDVRDIGSKLGVAHVLEGSVRRQGDQVRVTAQLIRVADGFHLWSNNYDRLLEDVFAIQDDIAGSVADALEIVMNEEDRARMRAAGIRNVESFVEFQKGVELFRIAHGTDLMENLTAGKKHFERAIEQVPGFGAAYWAMADYYAHAIFDSDWAVDRRAEALDDLRDVLDQAYAHSGPARRAFVDVDRVLFSDDWTPLASRIEVALAMEACPDPTWIQLAMVLGYEAELADMWRRYERCEPLSVQAVNEQGIAEVFLKRPQEALRRYQEARGRFGAHLVLVSGHQRALMASGRHEEALALAPQVIEDDDFFGWTAETTPLAGMGRIEAARAALEDWVVKRGEFESIDVWAAIGDWEAANALAAEIDARPAGPVLLLLHTYRCLCGSAFDLSVTPRFEARIEESGLPWPPSKVIDFPAKDW